VKKYISLKSLLITWAVLFALLFILGSLSRASDFLSNLGPFIIGGAIITFPVSLVICLIWGAFQYLKNREKVAVIQNAKVAGRFSSIKIAVICACAVTFANFLYVVMVFLTFGFAYFLLVIVNTIIAATRYPTIWLVKLLGLDTTMFYHLDGTLGFPYPSLTVAGYVVTLIIWFVFFYAIVSFFSRSRKAVVSPV